MTKMNLFDSGSIAAEVIGKNGIESYAVKPSPRFTALDGGTFSRALDGSETGEPFNARKFAAHLRKRRRADGVNFDAVLEAHRAVYPHECTPSAILAARKLF